MVEYLLDANALLPLLRSAYEEKDKIALITNSIVLDLTKYEIGNALWKSSELVSTLSREEVDILVHALGKVLRNLDSLGLGDVVENSKKGQVGGAVASKKEVAEEETYDNIVASVLSIARKERATFYDSSYVYVAKVQGLTFVTEDARLSRVAKKYVKTKTLGQVMFSSTRAKQESSHSDPRNASGD